MCPPGTHPPKLRQTRAKIHRRSHLHAAPTHLPLAASLGEFDRVGRNRPKSGHAWPTLAVSSQTMPPECWNLPQGWSSSGVADQVQAWSRSRGNDGQAVPPLADDGRKLAGRPRRNLVKHGQDLPWPSERHFSGMCCLAASLTNRSILKEHVPKMLKTSISRRDVGVAVTCSKNARKITLHRTCRPRDAGS